MILHSPEVRKKCYGNSQCLPTLLERGTLMIDEPADRNLRLHALRETKDWDPSTELKFGVVPNPLPQVTLGDIGIAIEITGREEFQQTLLTVPCHADDLIGIEPSSI